MKKILVFDIGGTNLKYTIMTPQRALLVKGSVATPTAGLPQFIAMLQKIIGQYAQEIAGIAISLPGQVDLLTQQVHFGGTLPFLDGVNFAEQLQTTLPIALENDGKAATLAELWCGALAQQNSGAVVVLGTAVGGGIVLNRQLIYGSHQQAGEFSFMQSDPGTTMQSTFGDQSSAVQMIKAAAQKLDLVDETNGLQVFQAINAHDSRVWPLFKQFCRSVALMIHNVQTIIDGDCYVISGGISAQPIVGATINAEFDQLRQDNAVFAATLSRPKIVTSQFHNDANLYGALYHFIMAYDKEEQNVQTTTNKRVSN